MFPPAVILLLSKMHRIANTNSMVACYYSRFCPCITICILHYVTLRYNSILQCPTDYNMFSIYNLTSIDTFLFNLQY